MVTTVVGNLKQRLAVLDTVPDMIALLRYRAQEELDTYWPEMKGLPLEAHVSALAEIKERLETEVPGMEVCIVTFDKEDYMDWLCGEDDTDDMRAQYAADRAEEESYEGAIDMSNTGKWTGRGESGEKYDFDVYRKDEDLPAVAAVYLIARTFDPTKHYESVVDPRVEYTPLYASQSANMATDKLGEDKSEELDDLKADRILLHPENDADKREEIVKDLISGLEPLCNWEN